MTDAAFPTAVPPGLKGVVVAETSLGDVRGVEGFYHYRQYAAPELAEKRTVEDVWHLLLDGELPSPAKRAEFAAEVAPLRTLPSEVSDLLPGIAGVGGPPLAGVRTAVSLLAAAENMQPSHEAPREQLRADALRITAAVPTIVTALHRLAEGHEPVPPRSDLGYAENYLWMLGGDIPEPEKRRAIEQYLILAIDHGFNASTFTARVVTSTGADLGAAIVAALGALSGPLHGGAISRALDALDEIGTPELTTDWVRSAVGSGKRIMGFGHPVYRTADPRAVMLRAIAQRLGGEIAQFAVQVEAEVERTLAELKPGRELHTNVDFYAAVVMQQCGMPQSLYLPTFAVSRVIGWCAQALEQASKNQIFRPNAHYVGPPPPQPVPPAE